MHRAIQEQPPHAPLGAGRLQARRLQPWCAGVLSQGERRASRPGDAGQARGLREVLAAAAADARNGFELVDTHTLVTGMWARLSF